MVSTVTITSQETDLQLIDGNGNPFEVPDYSFNDILKSIPRHCFQRSAAHSLLFVARDLLCIALTFYATLTLTAHIESQILRGVVYAVYGFIVGLFGTGIWVLAHECGHGSFSSSNTINDICGWIMHTSLFVPYFSWKYTHAQHHHYTGNLHKDTVFVPKSREKFLSVNNITELTEESPAASLFWLLTQQLFGWPYHLISNVTGQPHPDVPKIFVNHFWPWSPLFDSSKVFNIILSDVGIACAAYIAYLSINKFGLSNFLIYYFVPYLWVNHWLVCITYLQHTDPSLPHYTNEEWTFAKGAAATIDRDFGFIGDFCFHKIIETHVAHHYCSKIPFYHAEEATEAIKKVMGKHYRRDSTNLIKSLWTVNRRCQFVEGPKGVKMFRNANGFGAPPASNPTKED
ncbi:hypothetical protein CANCADRAFT_31962 [Tortispora caseinolytica NRRL Y-17796]|uniref:Fatty acid desaturase domain-containing protein n=1 Tax=Tortispora caseinolytica NRRL Y-17796 TaxID=767744 RepID=A0A1E4THQ6_9ASCO|nr:hypothetical protein CANCADRAFT_31962 [Tortispora caseinolytica NRRL Y-17796]